ncbi:MAG: hypothetical protein A3G87_04590 [Omnitrophica bacterium RIFCSPLOWO2_12_FULL_50_11]|nr:MAG: hypothetical protein A3G87_04590 [Omnitrophica bacterium RIFCSPLOWO2_12_FULL_50_11]
MRRLGNGSDRGKGRDVSNRITVVTAIFASVVFAGAAIGLWNHRLCAEAPWLPQSFEVTYAGKILLEAGDAKKVRVWIPLASDHSGQKVLERDIKLPRQFQTTKDPIYGNEIAYFELKPPLPASIDFSIQYVAEVSRDEFYRRNKEDTLEKYLTPSRLMIINDDVVRRARESTKGQTNVIAKARAIYEHVIANVVYDKKTPGWGRGDTARVCLLGRGNCTDFHSLFVSMSHASHIPARFKIGLMIPDQEEGNIPGYHCWAEFYEPRKGWQPVDVSEAWKDPELQDAYFANFSTNKFLISVGRDISLVPQQSGEPVNILFYPYVEVDGQAVQAKIETDFHFKKKEE